jgi:excinuclease UvrABC ATPase subunit
VSLLEFRIRIQNQIYFLSIHQKACDHCNGLGTVNEINPKKIIPNPKLSIKAGGFAPWANTKALGYCN